MSDSEERKNIFTEYSGDCPMIASTKQNGNCELCPMHGKTSQTEKHDEGEKQDLEKPEKKNKE